MIIVNKSLVCLSVNGGLIAEASTLGLPPGEWPEFISVVDDSNSGFLFQLQGPDMRGAVLAGYRYQSKAGHRLLVLNDSA
jgi:hypothetical protein